MKKLPAIILLGIILLVTIAGLVGFIPFTPGSGNTYTSDYGSSSSSSSASEYDYDDYDYDDYSYNYNYNSGYSDYGSGYYSGIYDLDISDVYVSSNSLYTICEGRVTNSGSRTYKFVQVKGAFKNSSGTVLDTDWTYAVGSEGLAPGESSTFRLSVDKDYSISSCSVSLLDYQ